MPQVNISMKKESRGDNVQLSSSAQRIVEGRSAIPVISSDNINFEDVFGDPPRRFHIMKQQDTVQMEQ
ncbi:hypothetical protein ACET3Z_028528 [Daucus carota]